MILFAPMQSTVFAFKINQIDHNSNATLGELAILDLFNSDKRNTGFGSNYGDLNLEQLNTTAIIDADVADTNAIKESIV